MSMVPYDDHQPVIEPANREPADKRAYETPWQKFVNAVRTTIGLKPLYVAERWALAKISQEEAAAESLMLQARGKYVCDVAEARSVEMRAEAESAHAMAQADLIRAQIELIRQLMKKRRIK